MLSASEDTIDAIELFPYAPYEIQKDLVNKMSEIVDRSCTVGILESPTGTGKTTSLLCGAISWLLNSHKKSTEEQSEDIINENEPDWIREARLQLQQESSNASERSTSIAKRKKIRKNENDTVDSSIQKLLNLVEDMQEQEEEQQQNVIPNKRVFYCSRTHSQLSQVMEELQKIVKKHEKHYSKLNEIHSITLSSRKSTCIHPQVSKLNGEAQNEKCLELVAADTCPFMNSDKEASLKELVNAMSRLRVVDVEDASRLGKQHETCPYYASKHFSTSKCHIITVPYSIILSSSARESFGIDLNDSLVIFDEGHNLIDAINAMRSASISLTALNKVQNGLKRYFDKFSRRFSPSNSVIIQQLLHVITRLVSFFHHEGVSSPSEFFEITSFCLYLEIDHINFFPIIDYCRENHLSPKLVNYYIYEGSSQEANHVEEVVAGESQLLNQILSFMDALAAASSDGRIIYKKDENILKYVSLSPQSVMKDILETAHNVILAGGTMRPMDDVISMLFPPSTNIHTLSCGHLPEMEQNVALTIIGSGPNNIPLKFTHSNRDSNTASDMNNEVAQMLSNLCNIVPDGIVCFFASRSALDSFLSTWSNRRSIEAKKKVFVENSHEGAKGVEVLLNNYQHCIHSQKGGALLLAVTGGRLSEGINFSDRLARAVVVIGMPYPNITDPEVSLRVKYQNEKHLNGGSIYLDNLCMRSVNQTIGRAIRNSKDYAAILLVDSRYGSEKIRCKLPGWMQPSISPPNEGTHSFPAAFKQIIQFFKNR